MKSEIARLRSQIDDSVAKLNNCNFMHKAPFDKIELERKKLCDFQAKLNSITNTVELSLAILMDEPFISYFIEELRFDKYDEELFSNDYYLKVNCNDLKPEEKEELLDLIKNNMLHDLFLRNSQRYSKK